MKKAIFLCVASGVSVALFFATAPRDSLAQNKKTEVTLINTEGKSTGAVELSEIEGGVQIHVAARGLPAGLKGIHLHEEGRCDPPDFKTAGGHYNPAKAQHGLLNPKGAHLGDLPNIEVQPDGRATLKALIRGATLKAGKNSLFKPGGTALVIHAGPDDLATDPSGGSGDRIACGVISK